MNTWCRGSSPSSQFDNWAVIALGGIPNQTKLGDFGIEGRIFPVGTEPAGFKEGEQQLAGLWYPIQVMQKDKVGRPDIDSFETAMRRSQREKGFFVAFDYTEDALREIDRFFKADHAAIVPLTVQENRQIPAPPDSNAGETVSAMLRINSATH
jgi:hypothetical protein